MADGRLKAIAIFAGAVATSILRVIVLVSIGAAAQAHDSLANVIETSKPSVVGIGSHLATRRPPNLLTGTGFVIGAGNRVVTNAHVVELELNEAKREHLVVFVGHGRNPQIRSAKVLAKDAHHDLAILAFDGEPLPALEIGDDAGVREGDEVIFIGYPIGAILGLYPVAHRGIISAISPIAVPQMRANTLSAGQIKQLREPFNVFQLDATAYPGNSGSPLLKVSSRKVIAVLNSVFVKGSKENVLSAPSGISYAIPAAFIRALLEEI
ncbi:MAG: serine protease [Pseudomonadota bacterium]